MQSAIRLQPSFSEACNNLASVYAQLGMVPQAIEYYMAALRINPRVLDVHQNLGDLWLSQGTGGHDAAHKCYGDALALNSQYAPAWRGLGDLLRDSGDHAQVRHCVTMSLCDNVADEPIV